MPKMSKILRVDSQTEKILEILAATYGTRPWNWHTRQTPFQVLIGTVLSQRTRDEKTDSKVLT